MIRLWVGVSLPGPWAAKHGLTETNWLVSPESMFAMTLMDAILHELPLLSAEELDIQVDRVGDDGEPRWEVKAPGEDLVDPGDDIGVAKAFLAVISYLKADAEKVTGPHDPVDHL